MIARSPVTEKHVGRNGMTLGELRAATITTRDNAAANPILASDGGPRAFAAFAPDLGDPVTRFDPTEPALNAWRDAVSNATSPWSGRPVSRRCGAPAFRREAARAGRRLVRHARAAP